MIDNLKQSLKNRKPRCTDLGNARRLVIRHGKDIRYCSPLGQWLEWNGVYWEVDTCGGLQRRAKETVESIFREAANAKTDKGREELASWAISSQSERALNAMIRLAESEPAIPIRPSELDVDPMKLNTLSGTVRLENGKLYAHRRSDLITKVCPTIYDPNAHDEIWERVLRDATNGDVELRDFTQRLAGYSITGLTSEEVMILVHGPEASCKTTVIEAIKRTLGPYAKTADFESFIRRPSAGGPRNDIARLHGARFVAGCEVDEGKHLAEGLVKLITGGDTVTARLLYKESFEFNPQFKLWLIANHAPRVSADDGAMWRRIIILPFTHQIPKHLRDPSIKEHLTSPALAGPAILQWLIKGHLEYQRLGLRIPAVVQQATNSYRQSQDSFADFIGECCLLDPKGWTSREARTAERGGPQVR